MKKWIILLRGDSVEHVRYIKVIFENVESIVIPISRIKRIDFGKLEHIRDYPFDGYIAFSSEYLLLDITYNDETDLQYNALDYDKPLGMFVGNPMSNNVIDRPNILGRIINHNDIVCIELLDDNQNHIKYIYVPWHDEDEYDNRYMSKECIDGILKIEIKKR